MDKYRSILKDRDLFLDIVIFRHLEPAYRWISTQFYSFTQFALEAFSIVARRVDQRAKLMVSIGLLNLPLNSTNPTPWKSLGIEGCPQIIYLRRQSPAVESFRNSSGDRLQPGSGQVRSRLESPSPSDSKRFRPFSVRVSTSLKMWGMVLSILNCTPVGFFRRDVGFLTRSISWNARFLYPGSEPAFGENAFRNRERYSREKSSCAILIGQED